MARSYTRRISDTPAIGASGLPGKPVEAHRAGTTITLRMTAGDSNSAARTSTDDRDLMKRLTSVLALIFAFTVAFATLDRTYSRKFFDITGDARWIWAQHRMSDNLPVAFFAARDFTLPEKRFYAKLKVLGDP